MTKSRVKCKTCGDTKRVQCSGCRMNGYVSPNCVRCYGIGGVDCPNCCPKPKQVVRP